MTNGNTQPAPPRFKCPTCQFAYECGGPRAWHCDTCGSSHDLRADSQFDMLRDDGSVNRDQTQQ